MRRVIAAFVCLLLLLVTCSVGVRLGGRLPGRSEREPFPEIFPETCENLAAPEELAPSEGGAGVAVAVPKELRNLELGKAAAKIFAYLAVLATVGGGLVLLRRRGGFFPASRRASGIVVVDTLHLGQKHYLAVVEWENRRLLLGVTPQSICPICPSGENEPPEGENRGKVAGTPGRRVGRPTSPGKKLPPPQNPARRDTDGVSKHGKGDHHGES